ncbi:hypothetical protein DFJ74DRAFT_195212, partial [Hyaloraphidium curvatum]
MLMVPFALWGLLTDDVDHLNGSDVCSPCWPLYEPAHPGQISGAVTPVVQRLINGDSQVARHVRGHELPRPLGFDGRDEEGAVAQGPRGIGEGVGVEHLLGEVAPGQGQRPGALQTVEQCDVALPGGSRAGQPPQIEVRPVQPREAELARDRVLEVRPAPRAAARHVAEERAGAPRPRDQHGGAVGCAAQRTQHPHVVGQCRGGGHGSRRARWTRGGHSEL